MTHSGDVLIPKLVLDITSFVLLHYYNVVFGVLGCPAWRLCCHSLELSVPVDGSYPSVNASFCASEIKQAENSRLLIPHVCAFGDSNDRFSTTSIERRALMTHSQHTSLWVRHPGPRVPPGLCDRTNSRTREVERT